MDDCFLEACRLLVSIDNYIEVNNKGATVSKTETVGPKTIMDALNWLKGDFSNIGDDDGDHYNQVIEAAIATNDYMVGDLSGGNSVSGGQYWRVVCTKEEFETLVSELSRPIVETRRNEHKAAVKTLHKMGYTWNEGELFMPPIGPRHKFDDEPSIYTQAMHNGSEPPMVGMTFNVDFDGNDSRLSEFNGLDVEVVGVCEHDNKTIITFYHPTRGIHCGIYRQMWVKPIDTRTEKEKVIDGIINDMRLSLSFLEDGDDYKEFATEIYNKYIKESK